MGAGDNRLMEMVDEKARLAGSNKMELLLFSLGGSEVFGINVFKVREVCETIPITRTPNVPRGVEGIIRCAARSCPSSIWPPPSTCRSRRRAPSC